MRGRIQAFASPFKGAQKNGNEGFFNNRVHRCERLISQLNNTEALCSSFTPIDPPTLPFPSTVWPIVRTIEIPFSTVADRTSPPPPSSSPHQPRFPRDGVGGFLVVSRDRLISLPSFLPE